MVLTINTSFAYAHFDKRFYYAMRPLSYYKGYLTACKEAIDNGVDLKGYFAWSMFDNFEWAHGYGSRFGLNWVDYETLERIPKASAIWFSQLIEKNSLD